jgi:hypothetical protein
MFVVTGLVLTGVTLLAHELGAFRSADLDLVDTRFVVRGERPSPDGVRSSGSTPTP